MIKISYETHSGAAQSPAINTSCLLSDLSTNTAHDSHFLLEMCAVQKRSAKKNLKKAHLLFLKKKKKKDRKKEALLFVAVRPHLHSLSAVPCTVKVSPTVPPLHSYFSARSRQQQNTQVPSCRCAK